MGRGMEVMGRMVVKAGSAYVRVHAAPGPPLLFVPLSTFVRHLPFALAFATRSYPFRSRSIRIPPSRRLWALGDWSFRRS